MTTTEVRDVRYAPAVPVPDPAHVPPDLVGVEFPGCTARRVRREELGCYEGRLEFWDAQIATAWVAEPPSADHEESLTTLLTLAARIAMARGAPIKAYGSMALMVRDDDGTPRRIMQADQSLYMHPERVDLTGSPAMVIGEHPLPDVVLEVDHTTDVRRGKLGLYESWGFPEVWVEVPDKPARSRRKSRRSGLTIHLLQDGRFRESPESHAFPGWTAEEIHAALNEHTPSRRTYAVLQRVGAALGAQEGTGLDDDPVLGTQRRAALEEGRRETQIRTVYALLSRRGIDASSASVERVLASANHATETIVSAALACTGFEDFARRLGKV